MKGLTSICKPTKRTCHVLHGGKPTVVVQESFLSLGKLRKKLPNFTLLCCYFKNNISGSINVFMIYYLKGDWESSPHDVLTELQ